MLVVYSDIHETHAPVYELYEGNVVQHVEVPDRVETIRSALKDLPNFEIVEPRSFSDSELLSIHENRYKNYLRAQTKSVRSGQRFASLYIQDSYTPLTKGAYKAARSAAECALTAAQLVLEGSTVVYALSRPPGHHAETESMGGYCYFNNAAIASEYLSKKGKVAILDIDFHHGNGTQQIFYDRRDVLYVSLHADPTTSFPYKTGFSGEVGVGAGEGYTHNFIVPNDSTLLGYQEILTKALDKIRQYNPAYLVLSLGFDTYHRDPIGGFSLQTSDFARISRQINELEIPTVIVQEGGYFIPDLGSNAAAFLSEYARR